MPSCNALVLNQDSPYAIYNDFIYAASLVPALLSASKDHAEDDLLTRGQVDRCPLCVIRDSLLPAAQGTS